MNKRLSTVNSIGATLLLTVFLVLCLTVFAVLTITSAKSDLNFAEKAARENTAYYEAVAEAEKKIADLARENDSGDFTFTEKIGDRKVLFVSVTIDETGVTCHAMKAVDTVEWNGNTKLDLLDRSE